jgi:3-phenylpropionate/trans-cinnamate dioxygenase ferredoxin reductase component
MGPHRSVEKSAPRRIAVVGASLAGLESAKELRRAGFGGELVIIGRERHLPYDRPPLSKELLDGRFGPQQVMLPTDEAVDVEWRLGCTATGLDVRQRTLTIDGGAPEPFDGIILATGAEARRPRFPGEGGGKLHGGELNGGELNGGELNGGKLDGGELDGIHVLRTLDDALALERDLSAAPGRVLVVGAGFIGAEVTSTCRSRGLDVTVVEGLSAPLEGTLGHPVGQVLSQLQRDHGVDLRLGTSVVDVHGARRVEAVQLSDGGRVRADVLVLAIGVTPATGWLEHSGLTIDRGVLCDETCLAAPGIVAAGDVARWPNRRFAEVRRVEHWDNAIRQGRHAARRLLAGDDPAGWAPYDPVPWFWSDQFGSKLQLVGSARGFDELKIVSGSLESRRFVGLYRRDDMLIGAVSVNSAKAFLRYRTLIERRATWSQAVAAERARPTPSGDTRVPPSSTLTTLSTIPKGTRA